jgi:hypothetical protein
MKIFVFFNFRVLVIVFIFFAVKYTNFTIKGPKFNTAQIPNPPLIFLLVVTKSLHWTLAAPGFSGAAGFPPEVDQMQ